MKEALLRIRFNYFAAVFVSPPCTGSHLQAQNGAYIEHFYCYAKIEANFSVMSWHYIAQSASQWLT